ncbi:MULTISPECIES: NAD(P)H-binding protein [unclassified Curtobacterium]|uniref:NAD(P)H-binding protein n=1 Tax=unclassified Curtobacterium TaxID=257496 RepID=UPI0015E8C87F|nr:MULTISPECIES: NAD(P)H-binding protein [unclassified Curtobacterium]
MTAETVAVTGGNGRLARATIAYVRRVSPETTVVAAARRPEAAEGVDAEVRYADYDDVASLRAAFRGVNRLLLVSGTEVGRRVEQHTHAAEVAAQSGVRHIAYTSAPRVDSSDLAFGPEHLASEQAILDVGVPYTFLRDNWYHENFEPRIRRAMATGSFFGNAGSGRVASAALVEYGEAAGIVLTSAGHEDRVYELAGDRSWSYAELAEEVSRALRRDITYEDLSEADHIARLVAEGKPRAIAEVEAAIERNTADGALSSGDGSLSELLGHETEPIAVAVRRIIRAL